MIILATVEVKEDEKAFWLKEEHKQSPGSKGFHRYRTITVNRDGNLADFIEDMGSVEKWRGTRAFSIPSLWEHTVAELLHEADYLRTETYIDIKDWLELDKMKLSS